jgi:hypothetical protein
MGKSLRRETAGGLIREGLFSPEIALESVEVKGA